MKLYSTLPDSKFSSTTNNQATAMLSYDNYSAFSSRKLDEPQVTNRSLNSFEAVSVRNTTTSLNTSPRSTLSSPDSLQNCSRPSRAYSMCLYETPGVYCSSAIPPKSALSSPALKLRKQKKQASVSQCPTSSQLSRQKVSSPIPPQPPGDWSTPFEFNVGGQIFTTGRDSTMKSLTLLSLIANSQKSVQNSLHGGKANSPISRDAKGRPFIDRDPQEFRVILQYLRTGEISPFELEADGRSLVNLTKAFIFYGIDWPDLCLNCRTYFDRKANTTTSCYYHSSPYFPCHPNSAVTGGGYKCCGQVRERAIGCCKGSHKSGNTDQMVKQETVSVASSNSLNGTQRSLREKSSINSPSSESVVYDSSSDSNVEFTSSEGGRPCSKRNSMRSQSELGQRDIDEQLLDNIIPYQNCPTYRNPPFVESYPSIQSVSASATTSCIDTRCGETGVQDIVPSNEINKPTTLPLEPKPSVWRVSCEEGQKLPLVVDLSLPTRFDKNDVLQLDIQATPQEQPLPFTFRKIGESLKRQNNPQQSSSKLSFSFQHKLSEVDRNAKMTDSRNINLSRINLTTFTGEEYIAKSSSNLNILKHQESPFSPPGNSNSSVGYSQNNGFPKGNETTPLSGATLNPRFKTRMCPLFRARLCLRNSADCKFAHGLSELRGTPEFFKTQICSFWLSGHCKAGPLCRHAHGHKEMREDNHISNNTQLSTNTHSSVDSPVVGAAKAAWVISSQPTIDEVNKDQNPSGLPTSYGFGKGEQSSGPLTYLTPTPPSNLHNSPGRPSNQTPFVHPSKDAVQSCVNNGMSMPLTARTNPPQNENRTCQRAAPIFSGGTIVRSTDPTVEHRRPCEIIWLQTMRDGTQPFRTPNNGNQHDRVQKKEIQPVPKTSIGSLCSTSGSRGSTVGSTAVSPGFSIGPSGVIGGSTGMFTDLPNAVAPLLAEPRFPFSSQFSTDCLFQRDQPTTTACVDSHQSDKLNKGDIVSLKQEVAAIKFVAATEELGGLKLDSSEISSPHCSEASVPTTFPPSNASTSHSFEVTYKVEPCRSQQIATSALSIVETRKIFGCYALDATKFQGASSNDRTSFEHVSKTARMIYRRSLEEEEYFFASIPSPNELLPPTTDEGLTNSNLTKQFDFKREGGWANDQFAR